MSPSPNPNGGNVTATKILWGQILIVFVNGSPPSGSRRKGRLGGSGSSRSLVLLGSSLREGRSMFPVTSFWWWYHYDAHAPRIFLDLLVRDGGKLEACRTLFGDSQDYQAALERHYAQGPLANWQERFVSAYATTHPWEDFAETWAHYLHIVDTLEMASSFGMKVKPELDDTGAQTAEINFDPYTSNDLQQILARGCPLSSRSTASIVRWARATSIPSSSRPR